jgi:hypothetical protein
MSVFDALFTGCCAGQFTTEVLFQRLAYGSSSAGCGFDAKLLEELDRPPARPPIPPLSITLAFSSLIKPRHLTELKTIIEGIINHLYRLNIPTFQVYDGKKWAAPKMMGDNTFNLIVSFDGYCNTHFSSPC